ncbi:MAG: MBL fold metallo-hydrolase [Deltaproteobacteria bacterium]|nr:MAG: MBL fold metallo-hydrolase [Deltaproteobacteria bacterium]
MQVHAVNVASFHPPFGAPARHVDGRGFLSTRALIVALGDRVVLVDSGFGPEDIASARRRLGLPFLALARPRLDPAETMVARLAARGLRPDDVTDILITHLDLDHAGGLASFPRARLHVHLAEMEVARTPRRPSHRLRYVPAHFDHDPVWAPFRFGEDRWHGFPVTALDGVPPTLRMVALPGHAAGHCGVLVERGDGDLLLHAGDAFMEVQEVTTPGHRPSVATRVHHATFDDDPSRAAATRAELLALLTGSPPPGLTVVNAHDPHVRRPDGSVELEDGLDAAPP